MRVQGGSFTPSLDLPRLTPDASHLTVRHMAKGSKAGACSAHVEAAKANCLQHARREGKVPSYVNPNLTKNNRVVFESDAIANRKSIIPLVRQAEKLYTEKTGQKCQRKFTPFREDVLKLKPGITDGQLMNFKAKVEAETGWEVIGIWLHQDEGHVHSKYIEGDEDFAINYHAHVLYSCQDKTTGKAIRLPRSYFKLRQDWLASATGMERGNPASETGRNHRSALQQRIVSQEARIGELERIAKEREKAYREEIARLQEEKRKAIEAAKAKTWNGVANLFGRDKEVTELKAQIKAVKAESDAEREKYKAELQKARRTSEKPLQDALRKIGAVVGFYKPVDARMTVDQIVRQVEEVKESSSRWYNIAQRTEKQLKELQRNQEEIGSSLHR